MQEGLSTAGLLQPAAIAVAIFLIVAIVVKIAYNISTFLNRHVVLHFVPGQPVWYISINPTGEPNVSGPRAVANINMKANPPGIYGRSSFMAVYTLVNGISRASTNNRRNDLGFYASEKEANDALALTSAIVEKKISKQTRK